METNMAAFALATGIGATATMDLWMLARRRLFGMPLPDYGMVGRWIGHMAHGSFRHERIGAAAPIRGERAIGWIAHYVIGVAFAVVLLVLGGVPWMQHPTPALALGVGITSVAAPFLLMQPGMGLGIAAS